MIALPPPENQQQKPLKMGKRKPDPLFLPPIFKGEAFFSGLQDEFPGSSDTKKGMNGTAI